MNSIMPLEIGKIETGNYGAAVKESIRKIGLSLPATDFEIRRGKFFGHSRSLYPKNLTKPGFKRRAGRPASIFRIDSEKARQL
jgi:hypothetical protein